MSRKNSRKPAVARRSLPKQHVDLDGKFILLEPPTISPLKLFHPMKNLKSESIKPLFPDYKEVGGGYENECEHENEYSGEEMEEDEEKVAEPIKLESEKEKEVMDDDEEAEEDASVIRCPCNNNVDFGLMIQCETCDVWQHSICVGIRHQSDVPQHYFCELCQPRDFNCVCSKNESLGKMAECTQCKMFQHVACIGIIRDPYVCPRCIQGRGREEESRVRTYTRGRGRRGRRPANRPVPNPRSPATPSTPATPIAINASRSPNAHSPTSVTPAEAHSPRIVKEQQYLFGFISDSSLCKEMELDHAMLMQEWNLDFTGKDFSLLQRLVLVKYCVELCRASPGHRLDIIKGLSVLLQEPTTEVCLALEEVAQELANVEIRRDEESPVRATDPYAGWTQIKANTHQHNSLHKHMVPHAITYKDGHEPAVVPVDVCPVPRSRSHASPGHTSRTPPHGRRWMVVARRPVEANELVMEYRGIVVDAAPLQEELMDPSHILVKTPSPFVLFLPPPSQLAVDARTQGSLARFVRRSCTPNAIVKQMYVGNQLRIGIFAQERITSQKEITIGFDFPWKILQHNIDCACDSPSCTVAKWFSERSTIGASVLQILRQHVLNIISPTPNSNAPSCGSNTSSISSITSVQTPTGSEGDDEPTPTTTPTNTMCSHRRHKQRRNSGMKMLETTLNPYTPPADKPSREQRKLEALVRTFEKMEKSEKRIKRAPDDPPSGASTPGSMTPTHALSDSGSLKDHRWKRKRRFDGGASTPVASPDLATNREGEHTIIASTNISHTTHSLSHIYAHAHGNTTHQSDVNSEYRTKESNVNGDKTELGEWRRRWRARRRHHDATAAPSLSLSPSPSPALAVLTSSSLSQSSTPTATEAGAQDPDGGGDVDGDEHELNASISDPSSSTPLTPSKMFGKKAWLHEYANKEREHSKSDIGSISSNEETAPLDSLSGPPASQPVPTSTRSTRRAALHINAHTRRAVRAEQILL